MASAPWDTFFYYGLGKLEDEVRQDLLNGLTTAKNKLFFNRSDSAGVNDYINTPVGLAIQIGLKYAVVKWIAYRNTYTGDGTDNTKERRIATSQNEIQVDIINKNSVDLSVFYVSFSNYSQNTTINIPLGV